MMKDIAPLRGWIDLGSDVNWDRFGGLWARKSNLNDDWYVLKFTNMKEAFGSLKDFANSPYKANVCEVYKINVQNMLLSDISAALGACGYSLALGKIETSDGEVVDKAKERELLILNCAINYGSTACEQLETFQGNKYAGRVRADARRYAERMMK